MKWFFGVITVLMLLGCGSPPAALRFKPNDAVATAFSINTCQGNQLSARITSLLSDSDYRKVVGDFVSVSMSPAELGNIGGAVSGSTGVDMQLTVAFDSQHQVDPKNSKFKITIRDSLVGTLDTNGKPIAPIQVVQTAPDQLSGSYDPSQKILQLQFADGYGQITVQGQLKGSVIQGDVKFQNSQAWDGSVPRSGTLGQFQAQSCSFQ
jgi:hypothetical protein